MSDIYVKTKHTVRIENPFETYVLGRLIPFGNNVNRDAMLESDR